MVEISTLCCGEAFEMKTQELTLQELETVTAAGGEYKKATLGSTSQRGDTTPGPVDPVYDDYCPDCQ